ncbi:hypothetical protein BU26DRAFT_611828 [Trematosphaeria pertusa]|uniref:F-box domain-containing protein n=1 Tax=Trematosphaeria pertusa TaxID=390896 RepID=A0A6A6HRW5_9PLEO|nr:uncharacterized protein BU26DRAFT_611828 [Trematosphaeria pertusa]KAF2240190.1 hypothetical protein BU26DRAFT_611828 [Trematosphaeria pertusa]
MTSCALLNLPDEILLEVAKSVGGISYDRQNTLRNLTLTCRRLQPIATEAILEHPVVNISAIHDLVRVYFANRIIAQKTKSLEVFSFRLIRHVPEFSTELKESCHALIREYDVSPGYKLLWLQDLASNDKTAYMAVLIALLPGLEDLRFGPNVLRDLAILSKLFCDRTVLTPGCSPPCWGKGYADAVFTRLVPMIKSLELPVEGYSMLNTASSHSPHPSPFEPFASLLRLAIPSCALADLGFDNLPRTLRNLIVVGAKRVTHVAIMNDLYCYKERLPNLREVRIFEIKRRPVGLEIPELEHVRVCLIPHIAFSVWRPAGDNFEAADANGQPWNYTDDELAEFETLKSQRRIKKIERQWAMALGQGND